MPQLGLGPEGGDRKSAPFAVVECRIGPVDTPLELPTGRAAHDAQELERTDVLSVRREESVTVTQGGDEEPGGKPFVLEDPGIGSHPVELAPGLLGGGELREREEGRHPDLRIGIVEDSGPLERAKRLGPPGQHPDRVRPNPRRGVTERLLDHRLGLRIVALEQAEAVQGPEGVHRRAVQPEGIHRRVPDDGPEVAEHVRVTPLHQEALRGEAPEEVVVAQGLGQTGGIVPIQERSRLFRSSGPDQAVDPAMMAVPERCLVRGARPRFEPRGRRAVLDDEVVPVQDPDRPVRAHLGMDRGGPLVRARHEVPAVRLAEGGADPVEDSPVEEVARGIGYERDPVPVLRWKAPGGVEVVPGGRGEAPVIVDLPQVTGEGVDVVVCIEPFPTPALRNPGALELLRFGEVSVGNRHVDAVLVVGRGTEDVELLGEAQPPTVVREAGHELQFGGVEREAEDSGSELDGTSPDLAVEAGGAHDPPDPVVESVVEVRGSRVGIPRAPAREDLLPHVRPVVASGVGQEEEAGSRSHDEAAIREDHSGRDIEPFGEHGRAVGSPVSGGVLQDPDDVAALPIGTQVIRIIQRLGYPEPTSFVEGHRDRVHDVGLRREELQLEAGRHLPVRQRSLGAQGLLQPRWLGPIIVDGNRNRGVGIGEGFEIQRLPPRAHLVRERLDYRLPDPISKHGVGLEAHRMLTEGKAHEPALSRARARSPFLEPFDVQLLGKDHTAPAAVDLPGGRDRRVRRIRVHQDEVEEIEPPFPPFHPDAGLHVPEVQPLCSELGHEKGVESAGAGPGLLGSSDEHVGATGALRLGRLVERRRREREPVRRIPAADGKAAQEHEDDPDQTAWDHGSGGGEVRLRCRHQARSCMRGEGTLGRVPADAAAGTWARGHGRPEGGRPATRWPKRRAGTTSGNIRKRRRPRPAHVARVGARIGVRRLGIEPRTY
jgi:hypothetical protein